MSAPQEVSLTVGGTDTRALRARIYKAHDAAHARACHFRSFDAGRLMHMAAGIGAAWAFNRRASCDDLEEMIRILSWLHLAAGALERLEGCPDGE